MDAVTRNRLETGAFLPRPDRGRYLRTLRALRAEAAESAGAVRIRDAEPLTFLARLGSALLEGRGCVLGATAGPHDSAPGPGELLIPTGGTTGRSRFARHTWETLACAATGLREATGGGPVNSLCVLPLHHVSGLMQAVPTQLQRLIRRPGGEAFLKQFDAVLLGGAAVLPEVAREARRLALPIRLCYGMTETAAMVCIQEKDTFLRGDDSCGPPLPHVRIEAGPGPDAPAPVSIRSGALFLGYAGGAARAPGAPFETADLGYRTAGGLRIVGRRDRVIVTGGENVDPAAVEGALRSLPGIRDAAVVGLPDVDWGERVAAAIVCRDGFAMADEAIRRALRREMPVYMLPKAMYRPDTLPLTAAGKVDYAAVRGMFA